MLHTKISLLACLILKMAKKKTLNSRFGRRSRRVGWWAAVEIEIKANLFELSLIINIFRFSLLDDSYKQKMKRPFL